MKFLIPISAFLYVNFVLVLSGNHTFPHIFNDVYLNCEYSNQTFPKSYNKLEVIDKLWQLKMASTEGTLFISPCRNFKSNRVTNCDNKAVVCLKTSKQIINYGKYFIYRLSQNIQVLESQGGSVCTQRENYTTTVEFSSSECKPTYELLGCNLRVTLPKPNCKNVCQLVIDGNIIDLTPLERVGSINVQQNNKSFELSFCKIISDGNSQEVNYDARENQLIVKQNNGEVGKKKIVVEFDLKCNWTATDKPNAKMLSTSSRKYRFQVESSLACIKLPLNCLIKDSNFPFIYNLTSLYKREGWTVKNFTDGIIQLNLCGTLNIDKTNNDCSEQSSQICLNNKNGYFNLGTIASNFQGDANNKILKGSFIDGSVCLTNRSLVYSTEINFKCSFTEESPVFLEVTNCVYKLEWITPAACPKYINYGTQCKLEDRITGDLDLNGLHTQNDSIYNLSSSSHIRYNLCGDLSQPCNNKTDISICLIDNDLEFPLGYTSTSLIRNNLSLMMVLEGKSCSDDIKSSVIVNFECRYSAVEKGDVKITEIKKKCLYEMNITTNLACPSFTQMNCTINETYDLSPLIKQDDNYYVNDSSTNSLYILNVCRSVSNTLCLQKTSACIYNLQEPHFKLRYTSIGMVSEENALKLENGSVVLEYNTVLCERGDISKTLIRFNCSSVDKPPILFRSDGCSHEFLWETTHACSKLTQVPELVKNKTTNIIVSNPATEASEVPKISSTIVVNKIKIVSSTPELKEATSTVVYEVKTPTRVIQKKNIVPSEPPTRVETVLTNYNCSITNNSTGSTLNLSTVNALKISAPKGNVYEIIFDESLRGCRELICINDQAIVTRDECPAVEVNYTIDAVKLRYKTSDDDFQVIEVWLKCKHGDEAAYANELKSTTVLVYPVSDVCPLLQNLTSSQTSSAGVATGVTVGLIITASLILAGLYFLRRYRNKYQIVNDNSSTTSLNVCLADLKRD